MRKFIAYIMTIALFIVISFFIFSKVITVGNNLSEIHFILEIVFYVLCGLLFYYFLLNPIFTILFKKNYSIAKYCDEDIHNNQGIRKRAKRLLKYGNLKEEDQKLLKESLNQSNQILSQRMYILYNNQIKKNIDELVVNSAKDTLILTAMSQNGFVDFIVVLTNNFRMIKKIIVMCGFRPTFMRTLKLYINVFFSSLVADGAQKLEMSSLISSSLTGLSKTIVDSIGNGAVNALFMLRIGMLTKNYLYIDDTKKKKFSLRNNSIIEACKLFPSVIMSVVTSPIKSIAKIFTSKEDKIEDVEEEEEVPEVKWKWRLKKDKKVR